MGGVGSVLPRRGSHAQEEKKERKEKNTNDPTNELFGVWARRVEVVVARPERIVVGSVLPEGQYPQRRKTPKGPWGKHQDVPGL